MGRDMCKILALSLVAGSQQVFEIRGAIMGVVMEGKEAGEAL
jgi:ABC-type arginine transport system permease subunit